MLLHKTNGYHQSIKIICGNPVENARRIPEMKYCVVIKGCNLSSL